MKKNVKFIGALALTSAALLLASCTTTNISKTSTTSTGTGDITDTSTTTGTNTTDTSTTTITTINTEEPTISRDGEVDRSYVYVSQTGTGDGTSASNPTSFATAYLNAKPGQTIVLDGGVYTFNARQELKVSGYPGAYITVMPKNDNERVVFDFSSMAFNGSNRGVQIYGDYWHFYGIEITGAGDNGMYVAGSHNIIENCMFYGNADTGLQLGRGYNNENTLDLWPSYNLIKNCTSFANIDVPTFGENADGFAAKLTVGYGNVFDGCMAFRNSDDGWDLFAKVDSGNIGTITLYNCVSFENGYMPYLVDRKKDGVEFKSYNTLNGDGIGFKLGGSVMNGDVIMNNCLAFNNKLHGFGDNSNPGVISLTNCTAFNNCAGLESIGTVDNQETDGHISATRGITDETNKSHNIDLARSSASYNNYYGVLSYTNNESSYKPTGESTYNEDSFKGATAYSIFNTEYSSGPVYRYFTAAEDASIYRTDSEDVAFSNGTKSTDIVSDDDFIDLSPINALCNSNSYSDVSHLGLSINTQYRNNDGSINMHGKVQLSASSALNTFADGEAVGATLNKLSYSEYPHPDFYTFENADVNTVDEKIAIYSAYASCQPITSTFATYQDFDLPKLVYGCDITWESSNTDVIAIDPNEETTVSGSFTSKAKVLVPDSAVDVVLTATITNGAYSATREFTIHVQGRNQELGQLTSTADSVIRVEKYGSYAEPRVYALDSSSVTNSELPASLYTLTTTYKYAVSGNAKFYTVDGVYTSIPGVYRVTVTATSTKDSSVKSSYTYSVYVVDLDCDIDFVGTPTVSLTSSGVQLEGSLSNIEGNVAALVSTTELTGVDYNYLLNNENTQYAHITTDTIVAKFDADNLNVTANATQYYVYYVVMNGNKSNTTNAVSSFSVATKSIESTDQFYQIARTGKLDSESTANSTTIYLLTNDLDFSVFYWDLTKTSSLSGFKSLFNGNGHTISNLNIETKDKDGNSIDISKNKKVVNVFYQLTGGTIMNFKLNEFSINDTTDTATQIGLVGELKGGYIYKIQASNVSLHSYDSAGTFVGKASDGISYISECQLINPIPDDYQDNQYVISTTNKYGGGIIGNIQANSDSALVHVYVDNCAVIANIGDGLDAGGNFGGIIGRIKNEDSRYVVSATQCYYHGTIIAKGQYNAGIIGDLESGAGAITVSKNYSDVIFVYNGTYLDAWAYRQEGGDQEYAHKNSNPIIGRATLSTGSITSDMSNVGTWADYYCVTGNIMTTKSIVFDLTDEDADEVFVLTKAYCTNMFKFDFDTVWEYDETTHQLSLKEI